MLPRPVLVALAGIVGFWALNPIAFIAEDSYFYAVVARNIATRGVQSFWATELTNGVHPLWLYLLAAWDWAVARVSADVLYRAGFAVPLSAALLCAGTLNWLAIARKTGLPSAWLLFPQLLFLGFFGLLYSEAHAAWCAHSLLLRIVCTEEEDGRAQPVLVGLSAAAVFLARTDAVFYVAAFFAWYAVRRRKRQVALAGIALAIPALAYVASNVIVFGSAVPVSGYLKSTFPQPHVTGLSEYPGALVVMLSGYSVPFGWVPLVIGAGVAAACRRQLIGARALIYPMLAGTLCHAVYTGFFTAGFTFWNWYYVPSITLACWSLACAADRWWSGAWEDRAQWAAVAALALALVATRSRPPTEDELGGLTTLRVVQDLGIDRATIFVSEWPGTLAFFTHNEVIAADMLTSNRRLVDRIVSSGDGFGEVLREARRLGSPIDYVILNGGLFLVPIDNDYHELAYRSPKMKDVRLGPGVGRVPLGPPTAMPPGAVVWKTSPPPTPLPHSRR